MPTTTQRRRKTWSHDVSAVLKRRDVLAAAAASVTAGLARPVRAQTDSPSPLRFVPRAKLINPDPIWANDTVTVNHAYMIWDTLYGIDDNAVAQPQMCAGHTLSDDELTWTFTLRDGLQFHDGEPVRAVDCTTSIARWQAKNPFGQILWTQIDEMRALDDKRFEIRLKQRFRQMLYALGSQNCFIMPARMAATSPDEPIKEYVGSGPFVFKADEWVPGTSAAYVRNTRYQSRSEEPRYLSGAKIAQFDRVEWIDQPDPASAAAALRAGEVDWIEALPLDLAPVLRASPGCDVACQDPLGAMALIAFNHLQPPFDNPKLLRALLPAIDQREYVAALVGEQQEFGRVPVGFFTDDTPLASSAGLAALTEPRDLATAKRLIGDSGYNGETIVIMSPSDQPAIVALSQVTLSLFQRLGLTVDYQVMDWRTLLSRRAKTVAPAEGGWSVFHTSWGGLAMSNPGSAHPLRGNGVQGWFGWPTDPRLEELRAQWFDAPDLSTQQQICQQIQMQAFESLPFMPLGQWFSPGAFRKDLTGFVKCANVLFWHVKRV